MILIQWIPIRYLLCNRYCTRVLWKWFKIRQSAFCSVPSDCEKTQSTAVHTGKRLVLGSSGWELGSFLPYPSDLDASLSLSSFLNVSLIFLYSLSLHYLPVLHSLLITIYHSTKKVRELDFYIIILSSERNYMHSIGKTSVSMINFVNLNSNWLKLNKTRNSLVPQSYMSHFICSLAICGYWMATKG